MFLQVQPGTTPLTTSAATFLITVSVLDVGVLAVFLAIVFAGRVPAAAALAQAPPGEADR